MSVPIRRLIGAIERGAASPAFLSLEQKLRERAQFQKPSLAVYADLDSIGWEQDKDWNWLIERLRMQQIAFIGLTRIPLRKVENAPLFDAIISSAGTEIHYFDTFENGFRSDSVYRGMLCSVWNQVDVMQVVHRVYQQARAKQIGKNLMFSPLSDDSEFALCLNFTGEPKDLKALISLTEYEIARFNDREDSCLCLQISFSADLELPDQYHLTLTPKLANKKYALRYLAERFSLPGIVITGCSEDAGDLLGSGFAAALIDVEKERFNGQESLSELMLLAQSEGQLTPLFITARGGAEAVAQALSHSALNPSDYPAFIDFTRD